MERSRYKWFKSFIAALLLFGGLLLGLSEETVKADGPTIIYVKTMGDDEHNDGTSWDDAFATLQKALDAADTSGGTTYQIWMAAGTYYPTNKVGGLGDIYKTFQMKNNVAIYGGLAGSETPGDLSLDSRNFATNKTILSGDLGVPNDITDNVLHVFFHPSGTNLNSTAILDGVTITGGYANAASGVSGYLWAASGGGMYNYNSSPTLRNVTISGNTAYGESDSGFFADGGGGMFNYLGRPILTNVTISDNMADHGGGMYNYDSRPILTNVTISGNIAHGFGGGMVNAEGGFSGEATLTNVTISGNTAHILGGGMYNSNSTPNIRNSIIWGNNDNDDNIYNWNFASPNISYSLIDTDPQFQNPSAGDYRLKKDSPAINAGNNGDIPSGVTTDLDGNLRISEGLVDLGAYEYQRPPPVPSNLKSIAGDQELTLNWDVATYADNYTVYQYEGTTAPTDPSEWDLVEPTVTAATYTVISLTNGTSYVFAVKASNSGGSSDYSNTTVATPKATLPPAPAAPSNLTSVAGDTEVTLSWDVVSDADSYTVYQYEGMTAPTDPSEWDLVEPTVTAATYTATGLANGTSYVFVVKASNSGGSSDYSNPTVATPKATLPPGGSNGNSNNTGESENTASDTTVITSFNGEIVIPTGRSGEVKLCCEVVISVPKGAAEQLLTIKITKLLNTTNLVTDKDTLVSEIFEFTKNITDNFKKPVTISFKFEPSKVGDNQRVAIFYFNEEDKVWVEVGGTVDGDRIAADLDHFTKFAVFAVDRIADIPSIEVNFSDIAGHWAESAIQQAATQKFVSGYPDGTFKPNKPISRAEFTTMLVGALKFDGTGVALHFNDQDKIGSWVKRAVALAVQTGIVDGYEDGSFRPDAPITRAEMGSMIAKALGLSLELNATTGFADDEAIPNWAKSAVEAIRKLAIVNGRGHNRFVPNDTATRAEAVVMLLRMLENREL